MLSSLKSVVRSSWISLLLVAGILAGALLGKAWPEAGASLGSRVDQTLLALVCLLFFGVRLGAIAHIRGRLAAAGLILLTNFLLLPALGYAIASVLLPSQPLLIVGLTIYFMSPCTDWVLGFTRLSGGNVALGAALVPVNMVTQLLLYPVYLQLFTSNLADVETGIIGNTVLHWFVVPFTMAVLAHYSLRWLMGRARFGRLLHLADQAIPWILALLVMEIFAANIGVILEHRATFTRILLAVFIFFATTFLLGESISRLAGLAHPEHALLTMSLAARNAPLMLAVTMAAIPGQPLIYAALIIGMLMEFPHLALLQGMLSGRPTPEQLHLPLQCRLLAFDRRRGRSVHL